MSRMAIPSISHKRMRQFHDMIYKDGPIVNESLGKCWLWCGRRDSKGYGICWLHQKAFKAHRIAYFIFFGVDPGPEVLVCHKCDNRRCVNLDHLFLGTDKDNVIDSVKKGRHSSITLSRDESGRILKRPLTEEEEHDLYDKYKM